MINSIVNLLKILSNRSRLNLLFLLCSAVIASFLELVGISAIVPFLGMIFDPESFLQNNTLLTLIEIFEVPAEYLTLNVFAASFGLAAICSASFRVLQLILQLKVAHNIGRDIGFEIFKRRFEYAYNNESKYSGNEISSLITIKSNMLANQVIVPLIIGVSSFVMLSTILAFLFMLDPAIAITGACLFAGLYGLTLLIVHKRVLWHSRIISATADDIVKMVTDAEKLTVDIVLGQRQKFFSKKYFCAEKKYRQSQAMISGYGGAPRFIIEAIALIIFSLLAVLLSLSPTGLVSALPTLGAFAVGAQKILPLFQQQYYSWTSIIGAYQVVDDIVKFYERNPYVNQTASTSLSTEINEISLVNVSMQKGSRKLFENLNFTIRRGDLVGIIGRTGSGKTTLVDVICALQKPSTGQLLINSAVIDDYNVFAYRNNISYVTQDIYLLSGTVLSNIAFGLETHEIDMQRVIDACKSAQILEDIFGLPDHFHTKVGNGGVKISGGQRQRIGIARALYKQSSILVFDESTNALDQDTERRVIDTILGLDNRITKIIISHNPKSLQKCDLLIDINKKGIEIDTKKKK